MSYENPDLEDYRCIYNIFASVYEQIKKAKIFEEREEFYKRLSSYNLIYWKFRRAVDQKGLIDLDGKPITSSLPEEET